MAPISPEFGKSLDTLRDVISRTEKELQGRPMAEGLSVTCCGTEEGDFCISLVDHYNSLRLCRVFEPNGSYAVPVDEDGNPDEDPEKETRPIADLPVSEKIRYARQIPNLIDWVVKKENEMPYEVTRIAEAIEAKLADLNR